MPKASASSKDAVNVSLGVQEGVIDVTKAVVKIHQYPPNKNSGVQGDAFPCVQLVVVRCDANGERIVPEEEIHEEFPIGKIAKFHPGKAESATDNDPEDMGEEIDTEGNCIYATDDEAKLNKQCKWIKFAESLEAKGFKAEVLGNGFMPDLVGLKVQVTTKTAKNTMPGATKEDRNWLEAVKILQFPYDKKKGAAKPTAKPTAKPAAAAPAAATGATGGTDDELALRYLTEVATEYAGQEGIERKKLQTAVQTKLMRNKVPVKQHKPVLDLVKSDEWLTTATTENEDSPIYGKIVVDFEAGTAQFAAAE